MLEPPVEEEEEEEEELPEMFTTPAASQSGKYFLLHVEYTHIA